MPSSSDIDSLQRSFRFYPHTRHPLLLFKDTEATERSRNNKSQFLTAWADDVPARCKFAVSCHPVKRPEARMETRWVYVSHQARVSMRKHTWRFPHVHVLISGLQHQALLPASALLGRHGHGNPYRPCQPNANNATFWSVMLPVVAATPPFSWPIIWSFLP